MAQKLYTEEQVKEMLELTNLNVQFHLDIMIPIELPSDEEIEINGVNKWDGYKQSNYLSAFTEGAKWMKEQILNQNK